MSRGLYILIVDDDHDQLYLTRHAAEKSGLYEVIETAGDGQEAFDGLTLRAGQLARLPDVVLTDLKMPGLDGIALILRLQEHPMLKKIPIVILTSSEMPEDRNLAEEAGAAAFLHKTRSLAELVKILGALPKLAGLERGSSTAHPPNPQVSSGSHSPLG